MLRAVLDTNVLIAAARAPQSASGRILAACRRGKIEMLVSGAVMREYERILPRALNQASLLEPMRERISQAAVVEPPITPRVVPDDPEDDKFVALARAGQADALISSDRHLKCLPPLDDLTILSPSQLLQKYPELKSASGQST